MEKMRKCVTFYEYLVILWILTIGSEQWIG